MSWIEKVKGVSANSTSTSCSVTIDSTGCDFCVALVADFQASAKTTITDTQGGNANTWTDNLTEYANAGGARVRIVQCIAPTHVGGTHVITAAGTGSNYPSLVVYGFSGSNQTTPLDQQHGLVGSSSTDLAPGPLTPNLATDLLILGSGSGSTATLSVTGETVDSTDQVPFAGGTNFGVSAAYRIPASSAAYNPTWHATTGAIDAVIMGIFKAAISNVLSAFVGEPQTGSSRSALT